MLEMVRVRLRGLVTSIERRKRKVMYTDFEDVERAAQEAGGFGVFIRSLVGLDRNAAKEAFAGFLDGKKFNATQIEFINLVIDHLAANGILPASMC